MAVCLAGLFQEEIKGHKKILMMLGLICSICAMLLSGTRGAWIYILVLPFFMAHYEWRTHHTLARSLCAIGTIATLIVGLQLSGKFHIDDRLMGIRNDIVSYQQDSHSGTSLGSRFLMWHFAIDMIRQKPILGWTEEGYATETRRAIREGRGDSQFQTQPHNEFLNFAAKFGLPGTIALFFAYISPAWFGYQQKKQLKENGQEGIYLLSWLIPLGFFIFGLSDSTILYHEGVVVYFYFLTFIVAWINLAITHGQQDKDRTMSNAHHFELDWPCTPSTLPATHTSASTGTTSSEAQRKNVV